MKGVKIMPRIRRNNEYLSNGVIINPPIAAAGENLKISYDGILSKNGSDEIIANVSFDASSNDIRKYEMTKNSTGFEVTIPVQNSDTMNITFMDKTNNADNNQGKSYTFDIAQ